MVSHPKKVRGGRHAVCITLWRLSPYSSLRRLRPPSTVFTLKRQNNIEGVPYSFWWLKVGGMAVTVFAVEVN